jgi:hypothetical protein
MSDRDLRSTQAWMLTAITHPHGVVAGPNSQRIDDLILPSPQQSAAERLAVYSSAYFARLLEVLRELFPCLRDAVGDEVFEQFAVGYLQQHPPTSYTLHRLADRFAEFLDATRPAAEAALAFVVDLARLEHAIDLVFDDAGPEDSAIPSEPAAGHRPLVLVPGFRLLAFRYPVSSYFTAWKRGGSQAWPEPREEFIALFRREYVVRRHELSRVQFDLLTELAAGRALDDALSSVAMLSSVATPLDADEVRQWFTAWSASGLFLTRA